MKLGDWDAYARILSDVRDWENFANGSFTALLLSSYVIFYPEEGEGKETVQENTLIVSADEGLDENEGTL